jgi:hypothetical protein
MMLKQDLKQDLMPGRPARTITVRVGLGSQGKWLRHAGVLDRHRISLYNGYVTFLLT